MGQHRGFPSPQLFCLLTLYKVLQGVGIRQEAWINDLGSRFESKLERAVFWGGFFWVPSVGHHWRELRLTLPGRSSMLKRTALAFRSFIVVGHLPGVRGITAWMSCDDLNSWTCPERLLHLGPWHRWQSPSGVTLSALLQPRSHKCTDRAMKTREFGYNIIDAPFLRLCAFL